MSQRTLFKASFTDKGDKVFFEYDKKLETKEDYFNLAMAFAHNELSHFKICNVYHQQINFNNAHESYRRLYQLKVALVLISQFNLDKIYPIQLHEINKQIKHSLLEIKVYEEICKELSISAPKQFPLPLAYQFQLLVLLNKELEKKDSNQELIRAQIETLKDKIKNIDKPMSLPTFDIVRRPSPDLSEFKPTPLSTIIEVDESSEYTLGMI